jgi:hypothetical protein
MIPEIKHWAREGADEYSCVLISCLALQACQGRS